MIQDTSVILCIIIDTCIEYESLVKQPITRDIGHTTRMYDVLFNYRRGLPKCVSDKLQDTGYQNPSELVTVLICMHLVPCRPIAVCRQNSGDASQESTSVN